MRLLIKTKNAKTLSHVSQPPPPTHTHTKHVAFPALRRASVGSEDAGRATLRAGLSAARRAGPGRRAAPSYLRPPALPPGAGRVPTPRAAPVLWRTHVDKVRGGGTRRRGDGVTGHWPAPLRPPVTCLPHAGRGDPAGLTRDCCANTQYMAL